MAPASVESNMILPVRDNPRSGYLLQVNYRYEAAGQTHHGSYQSRFVWREDAEKLVESLQNGPLFVRYNPDEPSDYFLDPYQDVRMPDWARRLTLHSINRLARQPVRAMLVERIGFGSTQAGHVFLQREAGLRL